MPDIVYCDNKDCCHYDDYRERCGAYKLVIERGVCVGSTLHGRNVSENDLDERLKAENEKLKKRLAQYELFREVVGDPAHEFASLRRELHRVERENAFLRACLGGDCGDCAVGMGEYADSLCDPLKAENADLRERISQLEMEAE